MDKYLIAASNEWRRLSRTTGLVPVSWKIAMALGDLFEEAAFGEDIRPSLDALAALTTGNLRGSVSPPEDEDEAYWRSILDDPQGRVPEDDDLTANALFE